MEPRLDLEEVERLRGRFVRPALVSAGHLGHHAASHVDEGKNQGPAALEMWMLDLVNLENVNQVK